MLRSTHIEHRSDMTPNTPNAHETLDLLYIEEVGLSLPSLLRTTESLERKGRGAKRGEATHEERKEENGKEGGNEVKKC